jgi:hypothetical protein
MSAMYAKGIGFAKKWNFFLKTPKKRSTSLHFDSCHNENNASMSPSGTNMGLTNQDIGG